MGRHPTGKIPPNQLRIILGKHREIMRRQIAGESQRSIAIALGMTETRVSVICNSPLYKREYAKLAKSVDDRFIEVQANVQQQLNKKVEDLQLDAFGVLEKIIHQKDIDGMRVTPLLKKDTALEVLELGGNRKNKANEKADAMSDVVKIISEGFKLAQSAIDERNRREEVENPGAVYELDSYKEVPEDTTQNKLLEGQSENSGGETIEVIETIETIVNKNSGSDESFVDSFTTGN